MARMFRDHKRTLAPIDVMPFFKTSANKHGAGGISIHLFNAWNPETNFAGNEPDHHIHLTETEACDLIAQLAGALKP